jgi:16S rRNA (cytosine967-C5)-methyltransferase
VTGRRSDPADVAAGVAARRLALDALVRIDEEGAYANLVTGTMLDRSDLAERDRHFVTELVYGTTRMRRACDHLVDRHRRGDVSARVAASLRLGAYQLAFADVAPHAAVDATVSASPKPARGLVNAVLRRVAADVEAGIDWPDAATRLSYPDWIVRETEAVLGHDAALAALEAMNRPATTHVRPDGYVQDLASQAVVEAVGADEGDRVLDLCAAPGGKATGMAGGGAWVVASDRSPGRARLVAGNAERLGHRLQVLVADGTAAPFPRGCFDRVLVDAPCSGLGVLRRRPDARWRIDTGAPARLAELQVALLTEAATLVAPGGTLVYSVCTLTLAEGDGVVARFRPGEPWHEVVRSVLAPDDDRDGMFVAAWRRTEP